MQESWIRRHSLGLLTAALVGASVLAVGTVGIGALVALATLGQPVGAFLGAVIPWLVGSVVLVALSAVLGVGLAVALAKRLRLPRGRRLATLGRVAERHSGMARSLDLAEAFAPEEAESGPVDRLRRSYVEGTLDEREFERKLDERMDDSRRRRDVEFE